MPHHSLLKLSRSVHLDSTFFPPLFLAPALQTPYLRPQRPQSPIPSNTTFFSSTASPQIRPIKRDKNKTRGVSAIRRTGPRFPLSISKYPLPEPVANPPARKEFQTRPDHGLWGFFNHGRTSITTPEDLNAHGRHWTEAELSVKSWEDLRRIWWGCLKEKNWLSTDEAERKRVKAGYGDYESAERVETVDGLRTGGVMSAPAEMKWLSVTIKPDGFRYTFCAIDTAEIVTSPMARKQAYQKTLLDAADLSTKANRLYPSQIVKTMLNIKRVIRNRVYAWEEAIKLADSPSFWRKKLLPKEPTNKDSKIRKLEERDDVLERLESGRPMVDDDDYPSRSGIDAQHIIKPSSSASSSSPSPPG